VQNVTDDAVELADACGLDPGLVCEAIFELTGSRWFARFVEWLATAPFRILVIVVAAMVLNRLARRAITRFVERLVRERSAPDASVIGALGARASASLERFTEHSERSQLRAYTLGALLRSVATALIMTIAALLVLGELSISLGPLIAGAGIAGIAIGFGAQTVVRDFLAGIFIAIEDQYGVGDVVDVGEASGAVERLTWRTTWLRDVEGSLWVVPNGEIRRVGNKSQLWSRTVLDIGVAYDTDIERAIEVIKAVADDVWRADLPTAQVIEEPEVWGVEGFGDNAITIRLVVKTDPGQQWNTAREIRRRLKGAFDEAGIEIPFPQRTVRVKAEAHESLAADAPPDGSPPARR
jgi:moderate conductance mechanosensitive channel